MRPLRSAGQRSKGAVLIAIASLVALVSAFSIFIPRGSAGGQELTAAAAASVESAQDGRYIALPVFNDRGVNQLLTLFAPHIRPGDRIIIVSGNNSRIADAGWVNATAVRLHSRFPDVELLAMTSGISNVKLLASGVSSPVTGIVYDYEPNFPNEPEFTWEFDATLETFDQARQVIHAEGLEFVGLPTGRPVLQRNLQRYEWDYGALNQRADELIVQTQTYCRSGVASFRDALSKLTEQHAVHPGDRWIPQITVAPGSTNNVPVETAVQCAAVADTFELPGLLLWWAVNEPEPAVEFLRAIGR